MSNLQLGSQNTGMGYVLVQSLIILGFQEEAAAPHRVDYPPGEVSEMVPQTEVINTPTQKSSMPPGRSHQYSQTEVIDAL